MVTFLLLGFVTTGATEWVREAGRKPYLIHGCLYSNGIFAGQERQFASGLLPAARRARVKEVDPAGPLKAGAEVFRLHASCHTVAGYGAVKPLVTG